MEIFVPIPSWNAEGLLPPINVKDPASSARSPYVVSLDNVVRRFATSPERRTILKGLIEYRALLHAAGLTEGFQWLNGSFSEEVERTEGRAPNDIDVVTFFHLSGGKTQPELLKNHANAFDQTFVKRTLHVDGYLVQLNTNKPEELIEFATYWYSMWSHQRGGQWKGYLQIDLAPSEDSGATSLISAAGNQGEIA